MCYFSVLGNERGNVPHDVRWNWARNIKYLRQHVGVRMTPNEVNCELTKVAESTDLGVLDGSISWGANSETRFEQLADEARRAKERL